MDMTRRTLQLSRNRARRWALLCAVRLLRRSVANGRPISLPNLVRLYRRRGSDAMPMLLGGPPDVLWLEEFYRSEQPFRETNWRRWCRAVSSTARRAN